MGKLINIDNGGTLTDIWVMDGDTSFHTKTITTPYDLSKCFFEGLKKASQLIYGKDDVTSLLQSTDHIRYSTTQGTNALVTKKGPRLGLVLHEQDDLDALCQTDKEREMFGVLVGDRVAYLNGSADDADYEASLLETVNHLAFNGANRIVVSYSADDYLDQETRFRRLSLALFPRHMLGAIPVLYAGSLSQDSSFTRRSWTALKNAFLHPAMEEFLFHAENKLREHRVRNPLLIYRNDGYAGRVAKTVAIKTYSSGPRAGMESAREYASYYGFKRAVTVDVGGTTSDIGLVEGGHIRASRHGSVEGIACSFPLSDIVSIGVGGGSVIRVEGEAIRVGPDSVGSVPGPVCFGLGGKEATVTDALLVMGLLDTDTYFGGELDLDTDKARQVIDDKVAGPLGISVDEAVHRMFTSWAAAIASGVKDFCDVDSETVLIAFGGGGPMGALAAAQAAGIGRVLIPRLSAVFSAHGIGFSDISHQAQQVLSDVSDAAFNEALATLRKKVERNMIAEGFELADCECRCIVAAGDVEATFDLADAALPPALLSAGSVSVSVQAIKAVTRASLPSLETLDPFEVRKTGSRALTNPEGRAEEVPVVLTEVQQRGANGEGPVIIEEPFWTCFVPPDWHFEFTANGDVLLQRRHGENA